MIYIRKFNEVNANQSTGDDPTPGSTLGNMRMPAGLFYSDPLKFSEFQRKMSDKVVKPTLDEMEKRRKKKKKPIIESKRSKNLLSSPEFNYKRGKAKKLNENLSDEDIQKLNSPEIPWREKLPGINLNKNEIREIVTNESKPPPGGFNRGIFGTVRGVEATKDYIICTIEFMGLTRQDDRLFRNISAKFSKVSGYAVDYRIERPEEKFVVKFKFNLNKVSGKPTNYEKPTDPYKKGYDY